MPSREGERRKILPYTSRFLAFTVRRRPINLRPEKGDKEHQQHCSSSPMGHVSHPPLSSHPLELPGARTKGKPRREGRTSAAGIVWWSLFHLFLLGWRPVEFVSSLVPRAAHPRQSVLCPRREIGAGSDTPWTARRQKGSERVSLTAHARLSLDPNSATQNRNY